MVRRRYSPSRRGVRHGRASPSLCLLWRPGAQIAPRCCSISHYLWVAGPSPSLHAAIHGTVAVHHYASACCRHTTMFTLCAWPSPHMRKWAWRRRCYIIIAAFARAAPGALCALGGVQHGGGTRAGLCWPRRAPLRASAAVPFWYRTVWPPLRGRAVLAHVPSCAMPSLCKHIGARRVPLFCLSDSDGVTFYSRQPLHVPRLVNA